MNWSLRLSFSGLILLSASLGSSAATVFQAERFYAKQTSSGSNRYDAMIGPQDGYDFHVYNNIPYSGIAVQILSNRPVPSQLPSRVDFSFETGAPLVVGRVQNIDDGPGNVPWMRYTLGNAITNFEGYFDVLEIEYSPLGEVNKFAVDFFLSSPSIRERQFDVGRLRFNSSIPLPEPSTLTIGTALLFGVMLVRKRKGTHLVPSQRR
jgi:hypothetical protein